MPPEPLSLVAISTALLQSCVATLVLIGRARRWKNNVRDAQIRTDLLLHDLWTWGYAAGLCETQPTLRVHDVDAPHVQTILYQLESLFSDLVTLKNIDGHLQLDCEDDNGLQTTTEDKSLFVIANAAERSKWQRFDIRAVLRKVTPYNALKWVLYDDEKFCDILEKAGQYIRTLEKYLDPQRYSQLGSVRETDLMYAILDANKQQSAVIGETSGFAVAAAATMKRSRLLLELSNESTLSTHSHSSGRSSYLRAMQLSKTDMRAPSHHDQFTLGHRSLETYKHRRVLVEWKYVEDLTRRAINTRAAQIAALLNESGAYLHSLRCLGYIVDERYKRFGFVFELPDSVNSGPGTQLRDLQSMFEQPAPSLNERLTLAITLLETILGVHTAGWLHKEIRSTNIILLRKESSAKVNDFSSWSIFVTGFVFARLDRPGEMTEPVHGSSDVEPWYHPALLSNNPEPFRKAFDLYSVGCLLLEIAFWLPLHKILRQCKAEDTSIDVTRRRDDGQNPNAVHRTVVQDLLCSYTPSQDFVSVAGNPPENVLMRNLESRVGKKYTSVVREFLANCNDPVTDDDTGILGLEIKARDALRAIAAEI